MASDTEAGAARPRASPAPPPACSPAGASAAGAAWTPQAAGPERLQATVAALTDPGGPNKQNQDDFFVWPHPDGRTWVICVLDGHGRELGQLASQTARVSLFGALASEAGVERVRADPVGALQGAVVAAHAAVKAAFVAHYEATGWSVSEAEGSSYLVKRRRKTQAWSCVHGGTTVSLAVLLDGARLIMANVGDSSSLLGGLPLPPSAVEQLSAPLPGCRPMREQCGENGTPSLASMGEDARLDPVGLTVDHGPENPDEFRRMRAARSDPNRPSYPEVLMVYDAPSFMKHDCPEIFAVGADDEVTPGRRGRYYKNVRSEWASLCTTPAHSRFQDALAFTRSVGDFHLQTYGVTCVPDVLAVDLSAVRPTQPVVLCVATDGFWDNWKYEDLSAWLLKERRTQRVQAEGSAEGVMREFMDENLQLAHTHFGSHADNMTAVIAYLAPAGGAEALPQPPVSPVAPVAPPATPAAE